MLLVFVSEVVKDFDVRAAGSLFTIIFDSIFFSVPAPVPKISFGAGHPTHALFLPIIMKPGRAAVFRCDY